MPNSATVIRFSRDVHRYAMQCAAQTSAALREIFIALILALTLTTGCSMTHGDPKNPKKNPHPVKRYEVTATADAPGLWDSVSGTVFFDVVNLECTPEDKFLGVHATPQDVAIDFEMTRVEENTWKGYFYRDSIVNEDYYGMGVCHWDATGVTTVFSVHGRAFGAPTGFEEAFKKEQIDYFKKSDFLDRTPTPYGALDFSANNPDYVQHPGAFFPVTVAIKEVTP